MLFFYLLTRELIRHKSLILDFFPSKNNFKTLMKILHLFMFPIIMIIVIHKRLGTCFPLILYVSSYHVLDKMFHAFRFPSLSKESMLPMLNVLGKAMVVGYVSPCDIAYPHTLNCWETLEFEIIRNKTNH